LLYGIDVPAISARMLDATPQSLAVRPLDHYTMHVKLLAEQGHNRFEIVWLLA
jgi:hypothetical protein